MKFLVALSICVFSASVHADIYKCTDAEGNKIYSPHPCEEGFGSEAMNPKTGNTIDLDEIRRQELLKQQEELAKIEEQKRKAQEAERLKKEKHKAARAETEKNQALIKSDPKHYSPYAIPPYEPDKLPHMVKPYEARLPEIEHMKRVAAAKALGTGHCIRVEDAELNEKSKPGALVFLVDCSSANKFYYTEKELSDDTKPASASTTATEPKSPAQ
jgi:hypothetical protein